MSWIAINIGTYNSSAAIEIGGRITKVRPLGSSLDTCSFPTVAYVTVDHHIRVCAEANAWKCQDPSRYIKDFKYDIHQEQLAFLGVSYCDIISAILKSIKVSAEAMLGGQQIEDVLLSIPNHYGTSDPRVDILKNAAQATGFNRIDFIKEALATSYHYSIDNQNGVALIYDLGEMMFVPALVRSDSGGTTMIASSSGIEAGGKYIDEMLYKSLLASNNIEYAADDDVQIQQINSVMAMCREIKEQLSEFESVSHPVPIKGAGVFSVNRKEFEASISSMLEKTYAECDSLLHHANLEWKDLTQIILVGGSSNIPCVTTLFQKYLSGKDVSINIVHNQSVDGVYLDPTYSISLGTIKYIQECNRNISQHNPIDDECLSNKEVGIRFYNGIDRPKNWLMAAFNFYKVLLENEDNECYNNILQIFQYIIEHLRIIDGTLELEPVLDVVGEDSVDLLVEYLCQLQDRYERLGYDTFVQEIYKLQFWIEIIEIIHHAGR